MATTTRQSEERDSECKRYRGRKQKQHPALSPAALYTAAAAAPRAGEEGSGEEARSSAGQPRAGEETRARRVRSSSVVCVSQRVGGSSVR